MSEASNSGRKLLGATAVMASGTMVSRVLGLIRAVMIAFILGNFTMRADVLTLALTVPSSLYLLLAGGTLNNVLVPQIVRAVTHDEDGGRAFVDRIMTGFLLILGALTVVFTVAAPVVMSIYTKSSWRAPDMAEHWRSLLLMSYLTMPQIFFYGIFFLIGQVLNAREKFGPMMWAPVLNNVVAIASLSLYLFFWGSQTSKDLPFTDQQVWLLGIGSTLGIAVQTLVLVPYLRRAGFSYRPRFDLKGTGLGRTFHVAKWMVGYVALTSLAQVVVTNMASSGGVNAYQQAYLIWILPHSLLTVSLATAMLPSASTAALAGDLPGVAAETGRALRLALTFLVPASVAFMVLADPITRVPFGNGAGASDYHFVAWALAAFGIGLVPYTIQYLYLRAFYALDNTRTPFGLQIWISGTNAALAVALVLAWNDPNSVAARLALAYSASYFLGAFLTHGSLKRLLPDLDGRALGQHLARLLLASAPAALIAWLITWAGAGLASTWLRLLILVVAGVTAAVVFFLTAKRLGIDEVSSLVSALRRKRGDDGEADAAEAVAAEEAAEQTGPQPTAASFGTEAFGPRPLGRPDGYEEPTPSPSPYIRPDADPDGVGVFVQVTPPPAPPEVILEYPEPSADPGTGRVLAGRYRLGILLAASAAGQSWLGQDVVLGRPVLVQLLPSGAPRTAAVLRSARQAAGATDARFLRVLDVVVPEAGQSTLLEQPDDPPEGAFVVYEYASGQTLEKLLRRGPLTGVETAWVIREISDAINGLHAQGQFHGQLNPATVLITNSGNLKILGYAAGLDDATPGNEAGDVLALGELLYACLIARWPLEPAFGLHPVPEKDGRLPLPSEVRSGVPPQLDKIVDRLLSVEPRGHAAPIETATELTTQLSLVLGPTSAASDLRARLNRNGAEPDVPAPVSRVAPPLPTPAASRFQVSSPLEGAAAGEEDDEFVASALSNQEGFTPVPPPPATTTETNSPKPPRSRLPFVISTFGVVLAVGIAAAAILPPDPVVKPSEAPPTKLAIIAADDFDPKDDGGSGAESPKLVLQAIDGNPKTAWVTEKYKKVGNFGGTKPGVGLLVDLGTVRDVTTVEVMSGAPGGAVQLMVPTDAVTAAPTKSVKQWHSVANAADLAADTLLVPNTPVRTRYLLIYLTSLPSIGKSVYQANISEIAVLGR